MEPDRPLGLLFTWATWVRLRHPTLSLVNYFASPLLGGAFALALYLTGGGVNFTQEYGVAHQVNGFLQILAPFFIGALAAISSLDRVELDMAMGGQQPTFKEHGEIIYPTRREFFGYLFGFLAAASILLYAAGAIAMALGSSKGVMADVLTFIRSSWILHAFRFFYGVALANILMSTFIGLHFLIMYLPSRPVSPGMRPRKTSAAPTAVFVPDPPKSESLPHQ